MAELDHDAQIIRFLDERLNEHFNRAHDERVRMEDNLKEVMNARFESSKQRGDKLESEIDALKEDVTEIRVDVAEIKNNGKGGSGEHASFLDVLKTAVQQPVIWLLVGAVALGSNADRLFDLAG